MTAPSELYATVLSVFSEAGWACQEVAGREVPTAWALTLPDRGLSVEVRALQPQAWMDTAVQYWEGPVRITGSHTGRGYLEMTGYD